MNAILLAACLSLSPVTAGPGAQGSPIGQRVRAFLGFVEDRGVTSSEFLDSQVAEALRAEHADAALAERLEHFRAQLLGSQVDDSFPEGPHCMGLLLVAPGGQQQTVLLQVTPSAPHAIQDIWFEGGFRLDPNVAPEVLPEPLTWDNLEQRMQDEVAAGFSGALLLTKGGKVVLDQGYGMANRELKLPCTPETIFATGSVPIDYTKAGILLLAQNESIELGQPITDFFPEVPEDKHRITLAHLMNGSSGLPDFHGLPSDTDPDHHWIDRDEAVRRILSQELLFTPGTDRQHSHSAWGLLAAVIEVATEMSYQDFARELLFQPAGMQDTGFFGEPIPVQRLAIGYGSRSDGEINAPPYWGQTSWLVMGSGGMTSTTGDMLRWQRALRRGELLSPEWTRRYWSGDGVLSAGDMYGFEVNYNEDRGRQFVLLSNSISGPMRRRFIRLGRELAALR